MRVLRQCSDSRRVTAHYNCTCTINDVKEAFVLYSLCCCLSICILANSNFSLLLSFITPKQHIKDTQNNKAHSSNYTDRWIFMKILTEKYLWIRKSPLNCGRYSDPNPDPDLGPPWVCTPRVHLLLLLFLLLAGLVLLSTPSNISKMCKVSLYFVRKMYTGYLKS